MKHTHKRTAKEIEDHHRESHGARVIRFLDQSQQRSNRPTESFARRESTRIDRRERCNIRVKYNRRRRAHQSAEMCQQKHRYIARGATEEEQRFVSHMHACTPRTTESETAKPYQRCADRQRLTLSVATADSSGPRRRSQSRADTKSPSIASRTDLDRSAPCTGTDRYSQTATQRSSGHKEESRVNAALLVSQLVVHAAKEPPARNNTHRVRINTVFLRQFLQKHPELNIRRCTEHTHS